MALTYYHSSEMGPQISVTFPPQTAVISRAPHPIPRSLTFTHLHSFFFSLTCSLCFFLFPPLPFSEFCSRLLHVCSTPASYDFLPHLLPFWPFRVIHHTFSYIYISPNSFFLFRGFSPPEPSLSFCFCLLIHNLSSRFLIC